MASNALAASLPARACHLFSRSPGCSALAGAAGRAILLTSQIKAVLSSLAEATVLPSGAKATAFTPSAWPLRATSSRPVMTSDRRTMPSKPAWTKDLPSGEKAKQKRVCRRIGMPIVKLSLGPSLGGGCFVPKVRRRWAVASSYKTAVPSSISQARQRPSGEKASPADPVGAVLPIGKLSTLGMLGLSGKSVPVCLPVAVSNKATLGGRFSYKASVLPSTEKTMAGGDFGENFEEK